MYTDITQKETLSIVIYHAPGQTAHDLGELAKQGAEEEQMPAVLIAGNGQSIEMANAASMVSQLGVGIGIDQEGTMTLTNFHMPADQAVIQVSAKGNPKAARIIGSNAARLFKGYPFKNWGV